MPRADLRRDQSSPRGWYGPFTLFAASAKQSGCPTRQPHATVNASHFTGRDNTIKDDGQSGSGRASGKVHIYERRVPKIPPSTSRYKNTSRLAQVEAGTDRLARVCQRGASAGAQMMNWFSVACELHRDWRNDIEGLGNLLSNHIPPYRNLMTSCFAKK
jgi:hypothetical protein